jgi:hypothetical protein
MVRLDRRTRALEANTLYHVRIERSLEQPLDLALVRLGSLKFGSLLLKDVYKRIPDNLAFLLWIFDAFQEGKEAIGRIDDGQVHTEVLVEHVVHLYRLVPTEHTVIDHDGVESSWGFGSEKEQCSLCPTRASGRRTCRQWLRASVSQRQCYQRRR